MGEFLATDGTVHDRELYLTCCFKAAEMGYMCSTWGQHQKWTDCLKEEWRLEEEEARALDIPSMNLLFETVQFITFTEVVVPLYQALHDAAPSGIRHLTTALDHAFTNQRGWKCHPNRKLEAKEHSKKAKDKTAKSRKNKGAVCSADASKAGSTMEDAVAEATR